jgi:hypothetical protein
LCQEYYNVLADARVYGDIPFQEFQRRFEQLRNDIYYQQRIVELPRCLSFFDKNNNFSGGTKRTHEVMSDDSSDSSGDANSKLIQSLLQELLNKNNGTDRPKEKEKEGEQKKKKAKEGTTVNTKST